MLFRHITVMLLLGWILLPANVWAQNENSLMSQEYFVQQAADEVLLIRINAFEAELESKIKGQGGHPILHSAIRGSRIAPLFQYIGPQSKVRQLDIEVVSDLYTKRSEFGLGLIRMSVWDDRSNSIDRAYQMLSFGLQASDDDNEANWTVKIDSLINAARVFQQFGMKEMRLWSTYLAAQMIQFHLHDYSIAYSMSREILHEVNGTRFRDIEIAALVLQTDALIGLKKSRALQSSADKADPVQLALSKTVELAKAMGLHFEHAQALSRSGDEFLAESSFAPALLQYQQAVDIADRVGAAELATSIRESIVQIHAVEGNVPASSTVLQEIESALLEEGGGDELALNLLAQGRLYIRSYHHLQAYEVLSQALIQQNDSAIRKQVNFELAKVFYATGRLDRSKTYLQLANISIESTANQRGNSVIDVSEGLRILANIYRNNAEYGQMQRARAVQGEHQPDLAIYRYEQALDELAAGTGNINKAQSLFSASQQAASTSGQTDLGHLSLLHSCALEKPGITRDSCSTPKLRVSYRWLESGAVPRHSLEAGFLWAKTLVNNGRRPDAIGVLDQVVSDIHFYRHSLPGVLGSWYIRRSEIVFDYYLELISGRSSAREGTDAFASLLALSKIRFAEKYSETDSVSLGEPGNNELLRLQLGERFESTSAQINARLKTNINQEMAKLRASFDQEFSFLSNNGIQEYLRGLNSDELFLTYHLNETSARVWLAKKNGVQQINISNAARLYSDLKAINQSLPKIGISAFESSMSKLGNRLITPVAQQLSKTIYFAPSGQLLGLPFDALRFNGRYLLEDHNIVNLTSFPAKPGPAGQLSLKSPQSVFLAGHPQDYSSQFLGVLDTSSEIQAVADVFIGPGLTIVQGAALLPDEFESEQIQQADLIHLSMNGLINLRFPEQSSFELSGIEDQAEHTSIGPLEIRRQQLSPGLIFLSDVKLNDMPLSDFNNQPALITDFHRAGARVVIANVWGAGGDASEGLVTDFYHKLEVTDAIADSLQSAKRQYLETNHDNGLYDWAGFQLYIE